MAQRFLPTGAADDGVGVGAPGVVVELADGWTVPVSADLAPYLPPRGPVTADRILRLDLDLQAEAQALREQRDRGRGYATFLQARANTWVRAWWSPAAHWRRRTAATDLAEVHQALAIVDALDEQTQRVHRALRTWVIDLDIPTGPLAQAAAGWQRSPERPPGTPVYRDEDAFTAAKPTRYGRRAWRSTIAGTTFGTAWRRDGDDTLTHGWGTWTIGYIPATKEIYATRHAPDQPGQVWLLGTDWDLDQAHTTLVRLMPRMLEPNSLALVAATIRETASGQPPGPVVRIVDRLADDPAAEPTPRPAVRPW